MPETPEDRILLAADARYPEISNPEIARVVSQIVDRYERDIARLDRDYAAMQTFRFRVRARVIRCATWMRDSESLAATVIACFLVVPLAMEAWWSRWRSRRRRHA